MSKMKESDHYVYIRVRLMIIFLSYTIGRTHEIFASNLTHTSNLRTWLF